MNKKFNRRNILCAIEYELGDEKLPYKNSEGFLESNMPDIPEIWGWENFYRSNKSFSELIINSINKSLSFNSINMKDIGLIIVCSSNFPSNLEDNTGLSKNLLETIGLSHTNIIGITLNGCNTLLSAIEIADVMVSANKYSSILIVSADKISHGQTRFYPYGIFSDSAASCIITSRLTDGYEIINFSSISDVAFMNNDAPFNSALALKVNESILQASALTFADIKKIFCNNLFLPIVTIKEQEGGFAEEQLYRENIPNKGHCFAVDTLINLRDYHTTFNYVPEEYFMLAGDSPGSRTNLLLRTLKCN